MSATSDARSYCGRDNRSSAGFPGRANGGARCRTFAVPDATPTFAESVAFSGFARNYNFNEVVDLVPACEAFGGYLWAKHQATEKLYLFTELMTRTNRTTIKVAPTPIFG